MENKKEDKKASWEKMKTANVLGIIFALLSFAFLFTIIFKEIPDKNLQIVGLLTGLIIGAGIGGVVAYFFNYKKNENHFLETEESCKTCGKAFTDNFNQQEIT